MNLRPVCFAGILLLSASACGARVSYVIDNTDAGAPDDSGPGDASKKPSLDDVWMYPACGSLDFIPAGNVRVGTWRYDSSLRQFVIPDACSRAAVPVAVGNRMFSVHGYWLDNTPTTNLCYSECVKRGVCTPPTHDRADPDSRNWLDEHKAGNPIYVNHEQATQFCAWRGGHLPSLAQLARAAQGDSDVPGVPSLTAEAIRCHEDPEADPDACRRLELISVPPSEPYPVGRAAYDVGPFGTLDIYGSVGEWTRTFYTNGSDAFCALSDGSPDFVTFPQHDPEHPQYVVVSYAATIRQALSHPARGFGYGLWSAAEPRFDLGFRCAYDNPDTPLQDPGP